MPEYFKKQGYKSIGVGKILHKNMGDKNSWTTAHTERFTVVTIIIESGPGAHLPNPGVSSRHSTGLGLRRPGTRDGT